jgi:hypothetical protein
MSAAGLPPFNQEHRTMPETISCHVCNRVIDKEKDDFKMVSSEGGIEVWEHSDCTKKKPDYVSRTG